MIVQACNTFDRFGAFRAAAGVAVRAAFSIIDANGVAADLTGRSIVWRFLDSRNAVVPVGADPLGLIAATIAGAVASFDMSGAATEALRNKGVAGFEIAMLVGTGRVVLHRGAAAIDDAAPFAIGTDGTAGTNNLTVMAGSSTLIVSAQGAPGSSSEAIAAAALANAAAADSVAKTAASATATGAAIAATTDCTAKTALAVTATGKADAATAAAKAATDDGVAKTALTVIAGNAANAGATAANTAAAQIVPEGGPSLLIKPGTGTFPAIADAYFPGRKSLYSSFDGLRRQLRGFTDVTDFARAAAATYFDAAGVLQIAASGVARLGYRFNTASSSWVLAGLLVEGQATNVLLNNVGAGAVAGTPGTMPTAWIKTAVAGITNSVIGSGVVDGVEYVDVRWFGTATANGSSELVLNTTNGAAAGQVWTGSYFLQLLAGAIANASVTLVEFVNGTYVDGTFKAQAAPAMLTRVFATRTLTGSTSNQVRLGYAVNMVSGTAYDFTLRLGLPQLEQGAVMTSPIKTTTAQVTRAADTLSKALGVEFNQAAQTALFSFVLDQIAVGGKCLWKWSNGANNITLRLASNNTIQLFYQVNSVTVAQILAGVAVAGTVYKMAFGFAGGTIRLVVNGVSYGDQTATTLFPQTLNFRRFAGDSTFDPLNGFMVPYLPHPTNPLLDATEFPRLLTVAEMQAYTA